MPQEDSHDPALRIVTVVMLIAVVVIGISTWISNSRTATAKATATDVFMYMQNQDTAGTLRGQPAANMADNIRKTLKQRGLGLDAINTTSATCGRHGTNCSAHTATRWKQGHCQRDSTCTAATPEDRMSTSDSR